MSTVDDAVEAGARAAASLQVGQDWLNPGAQFGMFAEDTEYRNGKRDEALDVIAAAWPILSAPIRELHQKRWRTGRMTSFCRECSRGRTGEAYPCPTMQLIIETDKELGCG